MRTTSRKKRSACTCLRRRSFNGTTRSKRCSRPILRTKSSSVRAARRLSSATSRAVRVAGLHPDPLDEIDFWTAKAADLNSLNDQLSSERMKNVLDTLRDFKSPIGAQV